MTMSNPLNPNWQNSTKKAPKTTNHASRPPSGGGPISDIPPGFICLNTSGSDVIRLSSSAGFAGRGIGWLSNPSSTQGGRDIDTDRREKIGSSAEKRDEDGSNGVAGLELELELDMVSSVVE